MSEEKIQYCPYCGHHLGGLQISASGDDILYKDAVELVVSSGKASAAHIQQKLRVGYARAANLMDRMEEDGVIGPADGAKAREVYAKP